MFDKPSVTSLLINDVIPIAEITHRIPSIVAGALLSVDSPLLRLICDLCFTQTPVPIRSPYHGEG